MPSQQGTDNHGLSAAANPLDQPVSTKAKGRRPTLPPPITLKAPTTAKVPSAEEEALQKKERGEKLRIEVQQTIQRLEQERRSKAGATSASEEAKGTPTMQADLLLKGKQEGGAGHNGRGGQEEEIPFFDSKKEERYTRYPWIADSDSRQRAARSSAEGGSGRRSPERRAPYPWEEDRGDRAGEGSHWRERSRSRSPDHRDWRRGAARNEYGREAWGSHWESTRKQPRGGTGREDARSRYGKDDYNIDDRWDPDAQGTEEDSASGKARSRSRSGRSRSPSVSQSYASDDGERLREDEHADGDPYGASQSRQKGASDLSYAYGAWGSYLATWDVCPPLRPAINALVSG